MKLWLRVWCLVFFLTHGVDHSLHKLKHFVLQCSVLEDMQVQHGAVGLLLYNNRTLESDLVLKPAV